MYFLELYFIYFVRWGTCLPQPMCRSQKQLFQMSVLSFHLVFKAESRCFSHRFLSFQESTSVDLAPQVSGSFTCCSLSLVLDLWTFKEFIKDSETKRFEMSGLGLQLLLLLLLLLFCVWMFCLHGLSAHWAWCVPEESTGFPETGVTDNCKLPFRCWGIKLWSPERAACS